VTPKLRRHLLILISIVFAGVAWLAVAAWLGFSAS
jgi:hypothetical protein